MAFLYYFGKGFYLIAELESDSSYAGCLGVTSEWSDWNAGYYWWFQSVYVKPSFRNIGVSLHLSNLLVVRTQSPSSGVAED